MIRTVLFFLIVFVSILSIIEFYGMLKPSQRWKFTKTLAYASSIAALSAIIISLVVFLF